MQRFWLPEEQIKEFQKATSPIKAMKILAKIVKNFFSRTLEISRRLVTIQGVFIPKKNLQKKQGARGVLNCPTPNRLSQTIQIILKTNSFEPQ